MVGFVDHDPVRPTYAGSHFLQPRQERGKEGRPLLYRNAEQVDAGVDLRLLQQLEHLLDRRRAFAGADADDAIEAFVIPFRIDDAHLVSGAHDPLEKTSRRGRLAAPGRTRHQHAAAGRRNVHFGPVAPHPEQQRVPRNHDRAQIVVHHQLDQFFHSLAARAAGDEVGALLQRVERVGHRHAALAGSQHRMIVFRVADRDGVSLREAQLAQRDGKAGLLVDAGRQQHHRALVEDDLQLESELADHFHRLELMRLAHRHDHPARRDGNAPCPQPLGQLGRRRFGEHDLLARLRPIQERAVLRHHAIEEIEPRTHALQVLQFAAGHQQRLPAALAQPLHRGERFLADRTLKRKRPVVVGGQREIAHRHNLHTPR